jgi:ATP-dependent protease HslVU (ClpYQ) peptidase subunit
MENKELFQITVSDLKKALKEWKKEQIFHHREAVMIILDCEICKLQVKNDSLSYDDVRNANP